MSNEMIDDEEKATARDELRSRIAAKVRAANDKLPPDRYPTEDTVADAVMELFFQVSVEVDDVDTTTSAGQSFLRQRSIVGHVHATSERWRPTDSSRPPGADR